MDHAEPVDAAVQRQSGLEVAHFGLETFELRSRDVGEIGDNAIQGATHRGKEITAEEQDTVLKMMESSVLAGEEKGVAGDIDGQDAQIAHFAGERDGEATASGADIRGRLCVEAAGPLDSGLCEYFRFGTRHDGGGGDVERKRVELGLPEDVRKRLAGGAAGGEGFDASHLVGGEGALGVERHMLPGKAGCGAHNGLRLDSGALDASF